MNCNDSLKNFYNIPHAVQTNASEIFEVFGSFFKNLRLLTKFVVILSQNKNSI